MTDDIVLADVDAHARLRGPFTAAGALMRAIVPDALTHHPELVRRYDIEIVTAAPDLAGLVGCHRRTLTADEPVESRIRQYPAERTLSICHGLAEFVGEYAAGLRGPLSLIIRRAAHADRTDADWLAILSRRADPRHLRIVVHDGDTGAESGSADLAVRYVEGDCTSTDPRQRAAYEALPVADRERLHDQRAKELTARGDESLRLGAIPFHLERGSDPGAAREALEHAMAHCRRHDLLHGLLDLAQRYRKLVDWATMPEKCLLATRNLTAALAMLGRIDEADDVWEGACAESSMPRLHSLTATSRAVYHSRYSNRSVRNLRAAKAWGNLAVVLAGQNPDPRQGPFDRACADNALALVDMHLGDDDAAMRRIDAALEYLGALTPRDYPLLRSVLRSNRAQLLARMGKLTEAVAEYTAVLADDPHHMHYLVDRGTLYRRLGRHDEAMADYTAAGRAGPPSPEPYYNRALVRLDLGDNAGAIEDLGYAIELRPSPDAYLNRAAASFELGDHVAAAADVESGLSLDPDHAHLLCLRGLLALSADDPAAARRDFEEALRRDETLAAAWANLGVLAFERGDVDESLRHLDRALSIEDDPEVRGNRGFARQHAGLFTEAIEDYTVALEGDPEDRAELLRRRAYCRERLGHDAGAARSRVAGDAPAG
ncbi:tetratricopeptide repeat protein [Amycolatopsis suaedae]|uniref:Tetratricopeptide repeat protein n=1 Tax=Amycolatopsis suaedae TaxID=2510978 RepID=A0A4Q7JEV5_9PSEU|nr:tetratricopeptide repeat protein [Amycolatopsis suaedae]RZQ65672.1 tetratricopeptide repeat protein [Amycolatopsis suaedae]